MEQIKLKCVKEDINGNGIVIYKNEEKKIPGLITNEEALFDVLKNGKYTNLKLNKIINSSPYRIKPVCEKFLECGGCQFMHISYEHEIEIKNEFMADLFKTSRNVLLKPIVKMNNPYNYRCKCQMTYKLSKSNKVVSGFYKEKSHHIITIDNCNIQDKNANNIINEINNVLSKNHIEPYDELKRRGIIRHVLIRYGYNTNEVLVCFVTNGEMFPGRKNVVNDLIKKDLGITTIVQNYNDRDTSIVLGDKERVLYNNGYIIDTIDKFKFKISSRSFYQVNPKGMELLYHSAIKALNIKNTDIVLDTYCGVGTIGILMSKYAKMVYGVEQNKDAYKDAVENAKINGIKNIKFFNDDSTRFIKNLASNHESIDLLVLDPPREGSTKDFINSVGMLKPRRVVYVSCDPITLHRDLYNFTKNNYKIETVEPVDMFPRTSHVETVVLLTRK